MNEVPTGQRCAGGQGTLQTMLNSCGSQGQLGGTCWLATDDNAERGWPLVYWKGPGTRQVSLGVVPLLHDQLWELYVSFMWASSVKQGGD